MKYDENCKRKKYNTHHFSHEFRKLFNKFLWAVCYYLCFFCHSPQFLCKIVSSINSIDDSKVHESVLNFFVNKKLNIHKGQSKK